MKYTLAQLKRLVHHQEGAALVFWAVILPVLMGMLGIGVETGNWYLTKRKLQTAADNAALAGAYESTTAARSSSANSAVASNGFGNGSNVAIAVNNPPTSGSYTANSNAVEVIITQPQNRMFSQLFGSSALTIKARAVAVKAVLNPSGGCVLALATSGTGITINGNATLNMPTCVLVSNSSNSSSISLGGSSNTNVSSLFTVGQYNQFGASTLTTAYTPVTNGSSTLDPYASLSIPSYSGCNQNNYSTNGTVTLSPGVYCNGLTLNAHANVTFSPGTYIIDRGSFDVHGQAELSGTGVTFILTSSTGSDYATTTINGGAEVSLSAPTSGDFSGIAFFQDRNAPTNTQSKFNGGSEMDIQGVLYTANGYIQFNGGNSTSGSCTQVVANTITFIGNNKIKNTCAGSGVPQLTTGTTGMVKLKE